MKKILIILLNLSFLSCSMLEDAVGAYSLGVTKTWIKAINVVSPTRDDKLEGVSKLLPFIDKFWIKKHYIEFKQFEYENVKLELLSKKGYNNKTAIYYVHGGAYLMPLNYQYRNMAQYIIRLNQNIDVILVDYRQLPKYKYPDGNNDVDKGLDWALKNYENVYIMGDSAGGNLVASTILKRRDEKRALPNAALLISPFLDISAKVDSRMRNSKTDILIGGIFNDPNSTKYLVDSPYYQGYDKTHPYISPIYADFKDFIPTYITVNKDEMLYDDSVIIYKKMKRSNIDVILNETEKRFHVYQIFTFADEAKTEIKKMLKYINDDLLKKNK